MAHLYKKIKNGREYYYIRETQRVYGKPTTINQVYLGTSDKVQAFLRGLDRKHREGFSPKEFGSVFLFHELDRAVDLAGLVNQILPPKKRTRGPSLGELFFYAAMNRAIAPTSKRHLASWFESTDIQRIRPLRLESLNSQNFWNHWDRVTPEALERISAAFFRKVHALLSPHQEDLVVEFTNLQSTPSAASYFPEAELLPLKRVGLALVTERASGVPVGYQILPGGVPPEGLAEPELKDLFKQLARVGVATKDLTFLFNHEVELEGMIGRLDAEENLHFLAACSPALAPEVAGHPLSEFRPLPCRTNQKLLAAGREAEQVLYYETKAPCFGRPRRLIAIYDPRSFREKQQDLRARLVRLRKEFLALQKGYRPGDDPEPLKAQLTEVCRRLELQPAVFRFHYPATPDVAVALEIDQAEVDRQARLFGRRLIVTDREDWGIAAICQAYLERCISEPRFSEPQSPFYVALMPLYHWTDSKVRIHVFSCILAITYLALLCRQMHYAGLPFSPKEAMEEMRSLRTAIHVVSPDGKLKRILENITETQEAILHALGYGVREGKIVPLGD